MLLFAATDGVAIVKTGHFTRVCLLVEADWGCKLSDLLKCRCLAECKSAISADQITLCSQAKPSTGFVQPYCIKWDFVKADKDNAAAQLQTKLPADARVMQCTSFSIAAISPRESSMRASVLSSCRRQVSVSKDMQVANIMQAPSGRHVYPCKALHTYSTGHCMTKQAPHQNAMTLP